jgi:chemotaxis signal transduction protein
VSAEGRFLVVRAGGERYGLALDAVREVLDVVAAPQPVPARTAALRGVIPHRERFLSLLHLGALLAGGAPPAAVGDTAVVVETLRAAMALEVDDVEAVVDRGATYVGATAAPWVEGVWRVGTELVTVLDLGVLAERVTESGGAHDAG